MKAIALITTAGSAWLLWIISNRLGTGDWPGSIVWWWALVETIIAAVSLAIFAIAGIVALGDVE